ncbi:glycoside hydrolase family 6 protein [Streptomyces sp. 2P-4]|uniref:glycoside hydrolase family 6 protein n=1 Tax=Streptomyces sp. 2P-4 TaxID=2931974 RepID=UPI002541F320|nr:glycoside hydrolase family 6 protein [Streptomyces sp. 2P-4]
MTTARRLLRAAASPALAAALLASTAPSASAADPQPVYGELAANGTFAAGTAGWWSAGASIASAGGALTATATGGTQNPWDAIVGQNGLRLRRGATYTLSFDAKASAPARLRATAQLGGAPYTAALDRTVDLATVSKRFTWTFTSGIDTVTGALNFQIGGQPATTAITLDNVSLTTSTAREGFYVDPANNAAAWVAGNPGDPRAAKIKAAVADHNTSKWFGDWDADRNPATGIQTEVSDHVGAAAAQGRLPVLVAYNIPGRDCGGASSGGAGSPAAYKAWIDKFAQGIAGRPAVVVLEPDAVAQSSDDACMKGAAEERFDMLRYATQRLRDQGGFVQTYLDAGNATWTLGPDLSGTQGIGLERMAYLLDRSGVAAARGVSVNVANFDATAVADDYGKRLAARLKADFGVTSRWVVDTARNGNGGYVVPGDPGSGHVGFCNPGKRKLGVTSRAGSAGGAEYQLWLKNPGDSDGNSAECPAGSPPAGAFSPVLAEALIDGR